jgi:DNA-binding GntR family transcriptional regulator
VSNPIAASATGPVPSGDRPTDALRRAEHLYGQVYEILWNKIISGEIVPRQRISDVGWAKRLEVSRTPVREAMRKLEQDGVLEPLARGGYEVRAVRVADLKRLYHCRAVLEGLAMLDAATRITKADAKTLAGLIERTEKLIARKDFEAALRSNTEFHDRIVAFSDNGYLQHLLETIRRLILFSRSALMHAVRSNPAAQTVYAGHLFETQRDHRLILERLLAKEGEGAATIMRRHLFHTAEDMERVFEGASPETP